MTVIIDQMGLSDTSKDVTDGTEVCLIDKDFASKMNSGWEKRVASPAARDRNDSASKVDSCQELNGS